MIRLSSQYQFPKDNIGRHFSHAFYTRDMVNGEKKDKQWLIYSKALDKAFFSAASCSDMKAVVETW